MTAVPLTSLETMSKEEKKERKRRKREKETIEEHENDDSAAKVKHDKKKKKKKKKHDKKQEATREEVVPEPNNEESNDKEDRKNARKLKRKAQQAEKDALLEKVPKVDEDGVAYSKIQIRRMMRRVKRGLPSVPTAGEEHERKRQEAIERKEEEDLYHQDGQPENKNHEEEEEENESDDDSKQDNDDKQREEQEEYHEENHHESRPAEPIQPAKKKKKRSKPVPADYVCQACKNKHSPLHWIYDCPDKVTMRGTNQVSKRERGFNEPNDKKIFCSGLPFDTKRKDVENMFKSCGKMVHCKLLTFEDTGRCKGQAYITFETIEGAKEALKLSGTVIEQNPKDSKKKGKSESPATTKELRLKVTKVLNRSVTKNKAK